MAMPKTTHPTKSSLIHCAADLLDKYRFDEITVEMVLDRSGVSKGSLYHHFEDLDELMDIAAKAFSPSAPTNKTMTSPVFV